jgi:phage shock protein PspC (stress-responsive transcriptional regulator)
MTLSDELAKLQDLHQRNTLTDDEYTRAKARLLNDAPPPAAVAAANALRLSRSDRWIGGVCGGLARTLGLEAWLVRLLFTLLFLCGGVGLLFYVLLWIFVPRE